MSDASIRQADASYMNTIFNDTETPSLSDLIGHFTAQGYNPDEARQLAKIRLKEIEEERLHASYIRSLYNKDAKTTEQLFDEQDARRKRGDMSMKEQQNINEENRIVIDERRRDLGTFVMMLRRIRENSMADTVDAFILDTDKMFIVDNDKKFRNAYNDLILKRTKTDKSKLEDIMNQYFVDYEEEIEGGKKRRRRTNKRTKKRRKTQRRK